MKKFVVFFAAVIFAASGFAQTKVEYLDLYMRGGGQHLRTTLMRGGEKTYLGRRNLGEVLNELAQEGWEVDHTLVGANRNVLFPTRHKFHIILKRVCESPETASVPKPKVVIPNESVFAWATEKKTPQRSPELKIVDLSVVVPDGVSVVDGSWVTDRSNVVRLTLPESTVRIRSRAFWDCDRLKTVCSMAQNPPKMGANVFPDNIDIRVPAAAVEAYKAAPGWKKYANRISGLDF